MAKKDNFGSAMFDMFGIGKGEETNQTQAQTQPQTQTQVQPQKAPERKPIEFKAEIPSRKERNEAERKPSYGKSIIAAGTTFEGNISTHGDLDITGEFKGNVYADGKVTLMSRMTGNIKAGSVVVTGCELNGDLAVAGTVEMDQSAVVLGNISAKNIICAGKVTGDLDIKDTLTLSDCAVVNGNIKMGTMSVAKGAKISGKIDMQEE